MKTFLTAATLSLTLGAFCGSATADHIKEIPGPEECLLTTLPAHPDNAPNLVLVNRQVHMKVKYQCGSRTTGIQVNYTFRICDPDGGSCNPTSPAARGRFKTVRRLTRAYGPGPANGVGPTPSARAGKIVNHKTNCALPSKSPGNIRKTWVWEVSVIFAAYDRAGNSAGVGVGNWSNGVKCWKKPI